MEILIWMDAFVYQILLPHWRNSYRLTFLRAFCEPAKLIYDELVSFQRSVKEEINLSPQTLVIEDYLNRKVGSPLKEVYLTDGEKAGEYVVNYPISRDYEETLSVLLNTKFKIAGRRFIFNKY